jgi:hypothetical protein
VFSAAPLGLPLPFHSRIWEFPCTLSVTGPCKDAEGRKLMESGRPPYGMTASPLVWAFGATILEPPFCAQTSLRLPRRGGIVYTQLRSLTPLIYILFNAEPDESLLHIRTHEKEPAAGVSADRFLRALALAIKAAILIPQSHSAPGSGLAAAAVTRPKDSEVPTPPETITVSAPSSPAAK